jgi:hypothetical protein
MEAIVIADEMSDGDHGICTTTATTATATPVAVVRASVSPTLVDDCPYRAALELEASMNLIALSGCYGGYGSGGACHRILPTVLRASSPKESTSFISTPSKMVRFAPPHHNDLQEKQEQQQQHPVKKRRLDRDDEPPPPPPTPLPPTKQIGTAVERTASFPLPRLARAAATAAAAAARSCPLRNCTVLPPLASFRATWDRVNRVCDAMDDTPTDREALVKELFLRSLSRHDPLERTYGFSFQ